MITPKFPDHWLASLQDCMTSGKGSHESALVGFLKRHASIKPPLLSWMLEKTSKGFSVLPARRSGGGRCTETEPGASSSLLTAPAARRPPPAQPAAPLPPRAFVSQGMESETQWRAGCGVLRQRRGTGPGESGYYRVGGRSELVHFFHLRCLLRVQYVHFVDDSKKTCFFL